MTTTAPTAPAAPLAERKLTGPAAYVWEFARRSRNRIADMHRNLGHEVTPQFDVHGSLWYVVQVDGRPTHLIAAGHNGEGYEYHLPADINPYLPFDVVNGEGRCLRGSATSVTRYY